MSQGWRQPPLSGERGWEPEDPVGQKVHDLHGCLPHGFELVKLQWTLPAPGPWSQNGKGNFMGLQERAQRTPERAWPLGRTWDEGGGSCW